MSIVLERNMQYMNYDQKKVHVKNWSDFRIEAMKEAEDKYGKLNKDNLKDIQNYMKQQEKLWKSGKRQGLKNE